MKQATVVRSAGEEVGSVAAPLRRRVEEALRNAIISGQFAPGERLRERDLVETLGVSRTSLREALRQIEAEGLVSIEPNRGPVVTTLSYEEVEELYEVRSVLEAQACSGFAERGSSAQMKRLREIFAQMTVSGEADDVRTTLALKSELYAIILDGCGNHLIAHFLAQLHNRAMLLRRTSLSEPTRLHEMLHEIATLLDALEAHDAKAAWSISVHHINQARRTALKVMRQNETAREPSRRKRWAEAKDAIQAVSSGPRRRTRSMIAPDRLSIADADSGKE
jgi:DNA-binding GntR family transcriptional regulator